MIITIYVLFMVIAFLLVFLGYEFDSILLKVVGFSFVLFINLPVLFTDAGIQYKIGEIAIISNSVATTTSYTYETFTNRWFPLFMVVIGLFGATWLPYDERYNKRDE